MLKSFLLLFLTFFVSFAESDTKLQLVDVLSNEIAKQFNISNVTINCKLLDNPINHQIKIDNIKFIDLADLNQQKGTFKAVLNMMYGHSVNVYGTYNLSINLPCLNKNVKANHVIVPSDVEYKTLQTHCYNSDFALTSDDIVGKCAKKNIVKLQPINKHMLSNPVLIDIGCKVKIVYKLKSLVLSKTGISVSKGVLGSIIKVRDEKDKNNIMDCKIIDSQTVELQ